VPQVLFIHGVNGGGKSAEWTAAINQALAEVGRAPLELAPRAVDFEDLLGESTVADDIEQHTTFQRIDEAARFKLQLEHARRASHLRRLAGRWPSSPSRLVPVPSAVQAAALKSPWLAQAHRYATDETRRRQVLARLLSAIEPGTSELVIVAHSLGSVVALDLLYLLPTATKVPLLVTAGSPLGIPALAAHLPRFDKGFPFDRVAAWVNIVEPRDPVTNGRGLSFNYPECLDVLVGNDESGRHDATGYFRQPVVGEILGDTLYGSTGTGLARRSPFADAEPTKEQLSFLLRLHYAKRLELAIGDDDRRRRFGAARAEMLDAVEDAVSTADRPASRLDVRGDLSEHLQGRFEPLEALTLLLLLAMSRPLDPYDIATEDAEEQIAIRNVLDDLGLKSDWAEHVEAAIREAEDAHRRFSPTATKIASGSAIALGAAVVIAAPFVIAPFAATGTAGAAALTSGLAGLGGVVNGGMSAGIAAVGALAASGGFAAAAGGAALISGAGPHSDAAQFTSSARAISRASAAEFNATVIQIQALALLRKRLDMADAQHAEWFLLSNIQAEVAEARNRVSLLSDKGAPSVKQWQKKQTTIDRTLDWMSEHGLHPLEIEAPAADDAAKEQSGVAARVNERIRRGRLK